MKKEIIMATAAAAAGLVYLFSLRKMKNALKKEGLPATGDMRHRTKAFAKAKGFSKL